MRQRCANKAFSLVELLIVMAIIIVLIAMLMPALSKAKESGKAARCAANLRQLQLAAMNFATDTGHLPYATSFWQDNRDGTWTHIPGWVAWYDHVAGEKKTSGASPGNGTYDWEDKNTVQGTSCVTNGSLWTYVSSGATAIDLKSKNIYLCPSMVRKDVLLPGTDPKWPVRSYSMNLAVSYAIIVGVTTASQTVLFGDDRNVMASLDGQFGINEIGTWHVNKGQVVYIDGHVAKL